MLRDYQVQIIAKTREILKTHRRPVIVAPTGSGKTHIATEIVKNCQENGVGTLFLAPRRELIYQTLERFMYARIESGMIMAGEPLRMYCKNQVASFDTLHARAIQRDRMVMPPAKVVVVDEAHLSMSKGKQEVLNFYKDSIVIGLTATPARGDGTGLGEFYDSMVNEISVRELIDQGHLVEPKYYAPDKYDLSDVKQTKSDYVVSSLAAAVDKPKLVGDIYENWKRIAYGKRTVIFCTNRKHSRHVRDEFLSHGIAAEHVDGETPKDERKGIFDRVRNGKTTVLCNVFVASYGLDIPPLEVCILARPTKNIALYIQTCGRVLRTSEETGKEGAIIIDHTGAVENHGFLDDPIPWSLDGTDIREAKKKEDKEREAPKEITCGSCGAVFSNSRICPACGNQAVPLTEAIPTKKADLQEIDKEKRKINSDNTPEQKAEFYGMLKQYGRDKGYKDGWASNQYRQKMGVWPNKFKHAPLMPPNNQVLNYIRSRHIAYSKSQDSVNA